MLWCALLAGTAVMFGNSRELIGEPLDEPKASGGARYWCGGGQLGAMQYTCYAFSELGIYGRCCYGG